MEASKEAVIQNLRDAGCCGKTVEEFLELGNQGDTGGQLKLLSQHRQQLLKKVHLVTSFHTNIIINISIKVK